MLIFSFFLPASFGDRGRESWIYDFFIYKNIYFFLCSDQWTIERTMPIKCIDVKMSIIIILCILKWKKNETERNELKRNDWNWNDSQFQLHFSWPFSMACGEQIIIVRHFVSISCATISYSLCSINFSFFFFFILHSSRRLIRWCF